MDWAKTTFLFLFLTGSVFADPADPAFSSSWLSLYHYEKTFFADYKSDVVLDSFFFSPKGRLSPREEFEAAIQAFRSPSSTWGLMKAPAACAYPARKLVLERLTGEKFPAVQCADLDEWINGINANQVSLVYVGAYSGNPASILGHTFLRFSNRQKESSGRSGADLLSYSVGFLAMPTPGDNPVMYALNGILGFYPGFFELQPHYMKVGLYNNSESRDLWEWPLDYTAAEVDLMVRNLWEMHFNGRFKYFFFDENCSYRLLKLLDVAREDSDLTRRLPWVVLPAETARQTLRHGHGAGPVRFRSSIERRMSLKIAAFSKPQLGRFKAAKTSLAEIHNLQDPDVLDALIDHWTHYNYERKTRLNPTESALFEATFSQRAKVKLPASGPATWSNEQIRQHDQLSPPTEGHGNSWLQIFARQDNSSAITGWGLSYTPGAHALWQSPKGYDDVADIEYLGVDVERPNHDSWRWRLRLARATSIEDILGPVPRASWQFDLTAANWCATCQDDQGQLLLHGSYGIGFKSKRHLAFAMLSAKTQTWRNEVPLGLLAPGTHFGYRLALPRLTFLIEHQAHWWRWQAWHETTAQATFHLQPNRDLFVKSEQDTGPGRRDRGRVYLGAVLFF